MFRLIEKVGELCQPHNFKLLAYTFVVSIILIAFYFKISTNDYWHLLIIAMLAIFGSVGVINETVKDIETMEVKEDYFYRNGELLNFNVINMKEKIAMNIRLFIGCSMNFFIASYLYLAYFVLEF